MSRNVVYAVGMGSDQWGFPDEGSYFSVNGAQTGYATAATPTAYSDTNPFVSIANKDTAKNLYLDFINLIASAAGTAGTSLQASAQIDSGDRYTSGGTDISANIINPNGNSPDVSIAKFRAGNITAAAKTTSARMVVGNRWLTGAIPAPGDTYGLKFGAVDNPVALQKQTLTFSLQNCPKIIIPPGWCFQLHLWLPSQSGASSYMVEAGWIER